MNDQTAVTNTIAEAKQWLGYARNLHGNNESNLNMMERRRKKAGVSYEDIGTTAKEVAELQIGGYKAAAQKYLRCARIPDGYSRENIRHMEAYLKKAGASYKDIGTTEAEVASLR